MGRNLLNGIPRVDPMRPTLTQRLNGRLSRLMKFRSFGVFHRAVMAPLDRRIMRLTKGRLSSSIGTAALVMLRTTGAKSGEPRDVTLAYFTDGDDVILIASNYGQHRHPSWYHNLLRNPQCELFARGRGGRFIARVATGADRDRLFALAENAYDSFRLYKASTADIRTIPVLRLSPAGG